MSTDFLQSLFSNPAILASLQNTLTPAGVADPSQAYNDQMAADLAAKTKAATEAATAAGTSYQQAAAAPVAPVDPMTVLSTNMGAAIGQSMTGDPGFTRRAAVSLDEMHADLIRARLDNLTSLKDTYDKREAIARAAGDSEGEFKAQVAKEKIVKAAADLVEKQRQINHEKNTATDQTNALERIRLTASLKPATGGSDPAGTDTDIADIATAIVERRQDPNLGNRVTKESRAIRAAITRMYPTFNFATAVTDWNNKENFNRSENSQRFIIARTAVSTFAEHLKDYEEFQKNFDAAYRRSPYRALNLGILASAKMGFLGPDAADAAAQLETNRGPVSDELATILAGGYAPQKSQIEDAHKAMDLLWGPRQQAKAIETVKSLVRGRVRSMQKQVPHSGAETNPYLQDVTPIDVFGDSITGSGTTLGASDPEAKYLRKGGK